MTFVREIYRQAETEPGAVAASSRTETLNYRQLTFQAGYVAQHANMAGLRKGDNLLFMARLTPKSLPLVIGLLKLGVQVTILDPFTAPELFASRVRTAGVTHMIVDYRLLLAAKVLPLIPKSALRFNFMKGLKDVEVITYGNKVNRRDASHWLKEFMGELVSLPAALAGDPALTIFTSGTTSEPKGVRHTYRSLTANSPYVAERLGIRKGTVVFSEPASIGLVCLMYGAHWVMPESGQLPPVNTEVWFGTPHDVREALQDPAYVLHQDMHTVGLASAPVTVNTVDLIMEKEGEETEVICFYGMTEFLPIAIGDAKLKEQFILDGVEGDYVGELVGDTSVQVMEDRELVVSGSGLMPGYVGREPSSELLTGDFGALVGKSVFLLGRKKDMYIRGSMNIYPGLYEPLLKNIEGVTDAAIVGRRDSDSGDDYIMLAVIPEAGVNRQALTARVKDEMLGCMDVDSAPDAVVLVESFPVSGRANKLDRDALGEAAWAEVQA